MAERIDIEKFLRDFQTKKRIWNVAYVDERGKNVQTLVDLELRPGDRDRVLESLAVENYCEGPLAHQLYPTEAWVFGVWIKQHEIYVKISMGIVNSSVICISFHMAEHPMKYPFKP